ncbi:MAG: OmpP1/FadL family transporter [Alphaproteobacteria bacterium]
MRSLFRDAFLQVACRAGALGLAITIASAPSQAGGLYFPEAAVTTTGTASAGAEAIADNATTLATNPAGMTRLEGKALSLGAGLAVSSVEFEVDSSTVGGGDGGDQGSLAPILSAFYVHPLGENLRAGLGLFSLSGAVLDPDDDWAGRFQLQEISLLSLTAIPSVAYRINNWFSVGAAATITYATLDFDVAAPAPASQISVDQADDVAFGYILGVLLEPTPRTRFGLTYLSEVDLDLSGDVDIVPTPISAGIALELPLAQSVRASVYHEISERWALVGSVAWEDWSALEHQLISTSGGSVVFDRGWEDTWRVALGARYRAADNWLVQFGWAYDTSPVDSDDRTADLPIDRQIRLGAGIEYDWSTTMTTGASFVYINAGDAKIDATLFSGEYETNHVLFFGLYNKWRW